MPFGVNPYDTARLQGRNFADANALNIVSPSIITDGLILYLDGGNRVSYPGSDTTWYDLSGSKNHGTLTNGPVYSLSGGGLLDFDGVDDFVVCPTPSTAIANITMMGFVEVTLGTKGPFFRNGAASNGYSIGIGGGTDNYYDTAGNNLICLFPGARWIATTTAYTAGWQMVTFILNSSSAPLAYINTTQVSLAAGTNPVAPTSSLYLGRNVGDEPSGARATNCNISNFMFYNRALTPTEVGQNFNAIRARFGI